MDEDFYPINMTSREIYFDYKRRWITLPWIILFAMVAGCGSGFCTSLMYTGWVKPLFEIEINSAIIFYIVMIGVFIWIIAKSLNGWFWSLQIKNDEISLKTFIGKVITFSQSDIQKFEWQKDKVTISTVSEQLEFNVNRLPIKSKIELLNILPNWLPAKSLPPEMQTAVEEVQKLASEPPPTLENPIEASTSLRHTINDMSHFMVMLIILGFIASVIYGASLFGFGIVSMVTILVCLSLAGIVWWSIVNKRVRISNNGIGYQVGFRSRFFNWEEIEAIAIQPYLGQLTIWVNGQYTHVPLVGLHPEQLASFEQAFSQQVYARNIPFGYT